MSNGKVIDELFDGLEPEQVDMARDRLIAEVSEWLKGYIGALNEKQPMPRPVELLRDAFLGLNFLLELKPGAPGVTNADDAVAALQELVLVIAATFRACKGDSEMFCKFVTRVSKMEATARICPGVLDEILDETFEIVAETEKGAALQKRFRSFVEKGATPK